MKDCLNLILIMQSKNNLYKVLLIQSILNSRNTILIIFLSLGIIKVDIPLLNYKIGVKRMMNLKEDMNRLKRVQTNLILLKRNNPLYHFLEHVEFLT